MKAMPADDDAFGTVQIREDGRKLTPSYLFQVKNAGRARTPGTTTSDRGHAPADEAFRPLAEGGCSLVH